MKYLVLVRHSLAQNGSFSVPDFERKLSNQGIARAVKQAEVIKKYGFIPDVLISSSAFRAMQTAELFARVLTLASTEKEDFLYEEYTTSELLTFLNNLPEAYQTVMVVGHNPTISKVANRLAPTFSMVFEPAAMAVVAFDIEVWSQVECGTGFVQQFFNP